MPRCPFAEWHPIGSSNSNAAAYSGGPYRIVHHTTEGPTAPGALATFAQNNDAPHFTVDPNTIWQHVDTARASRSLRHPAGTPPTNGRSAVQIEVVGFTAKPKNIETLKNVARLCRWIEATHDIKQVWPAGPPALPPDYHSNRSVDIWNKVGGHYGHCHVPHNTHVDPGYVEFELKIVTPLAFDVPVAQLDAKE